MEYLTRSRVMEDLQEPFQQYLERFELDEIGVYEEDGQDDIYHMGYTVTKNGKTYHIHTSFRKNDKDGLSPLNNLWTLEPDDPSFGDRTGYRDVESVFREI
ncbi:DUF5634 family protein [Robertmurraya massiliosenegalensis]|uniref:DUF5634 family protein n=1 Tax=Robertmurraya TaxID=2837507 RepID=UPI0039A4A479